MSARLTKGLVRRPTVGFIRGLSLLLLALLGLGLTACTTREALIGTGAAVAGAAVGAYGYHEYKENEDDKDHHDHDDDHDDHHDRGRHH